MTSNKSRFVTACQQLLALGLVVAALTPAANLVSLTVVPDNPAAQTAPAPASMAAYARASARTAQVPTEAVDATVTEYSLTARPGARMAPGALKARTAVAPGGASEVTSEPLPITGYGAVGVTWQNGVEIAADAIDIEVRLQEGEGWSGWMHVEYDDDHGPTAGTDEAQGARPGTDALLVGDVDQVQVRVESDEAAPADLKLAVIDPGEATATAEEAPAIDTGATDGAVGDPAEPVPAAAASSKPGEDALDLQATTVTPKPKIFSRAQWGADERLRDQGSPSYFEVHAGFVHHTVNANAYTEAQVPGILRSIYAYHTRSLGWSDVGYNYLVDRFGRIWEGRAGGVDRPVVGAHTLGYNSDSFAMSAIGNFETAKPKPAVIQAYGALMAWKLSLHGVDASSNRQFVTSRNFPAINGHRDAGSTACPGRYLYAKLGRIRELAAETQRGWSGRERKDNLAATQLPDLVVRRASDGKGFILPIKGKVQRQNFRAGKPIPIAVNLAGVASILNVGDWDRDGFNDLVTLKKTNGTLYLRRGLGQGRFAGVQRLAAGFGAVRMLAAAGDVTGDGLPDLVGQPKGSSIRIYPGNRGKGLKPSYVAHSAINATRQIPVGLWNGDGAPDSIFRKGPALTLYPGNGPGGFTGSRSLGFDAKPYDWMVGISDVGLTGHSDVVLRTRGTGQLWLSQGSGAGLGKPALLGTGMQIYDKVG